MSKRQVLPMPPIESASQQSHPYPEDPIESAEPFDEAMGDDDGLAGEGLPDPRRTACTPAQPLRGRPRRPARAGVRWPCRRSRRSTPTWRA